MYLALLQFRPRILISSVVSRAPLGKCISLSYHAWPFPHLPAGSCSRQNPFIVASSEIVTLEEIMATKPCPDKGKPDVERETPFVTRQASPPISGRFLLGGGKGCDVIYRKRNSGSDGRGCAGCRTLVVHRDKWPIENGTYPTAMVELPAAAPSKANSDGAGERWVVDRWVDNRPAAVQNCPLDHEIRENP